VDDSKLSPEFIAHKHQITSKPSTENTPPKSKAEMESMAELAKVQTVRLAGTLGIYEENPEAVSEAISNFL